MSSNGPLGQLSIPREVTLKAAQGSCLCTTGSKECAIRYDTDVKQANYFF